jgi:hypothetical protein
MAPGGCINLVRAKKVSFLRNGIKITKLIQYVGAISSGRVENRDSSRTAEVQAFAAGSRTDQANQPAELRRYERRAA